MGVSERFQGANVIDAGQRSPYWGEHVARYVFALPYVKDKRVLDIACGTGYGLGFLRSQAKHVTGVDVSLEAASQARLECSENAAVLLGDGTCLPFKDSSFDVVTSFETIEHLYQRSQFLKELNRVLNPGGRLILSTPNAKYSQPVNGKPANPFHIFEYTPKELTAEFDGVFDIEQHLGQSLNESVRIPPFYQEQERLPKSATTQWLLLGWKIINKLPIKLRELVSMAIWKKPFYPTEKDYIFSSEALEKAPVQLVVSQKK
jgi:ubiquinone/menaquinone biosynthesis C-methylase UbiE